jgi:hypothetical protein
MYFSNIFMNKFRNFQTYSSLIFLLKIQVSLLRIFMKTSKNLQIYISLIFLLKIHIFFGIFQYIYHESFQKNPKTSLIIYCLWHHVYTKSWHWLTSPKNLKTNKHNIVIQIKPQKLTKYTIVWAQFMVMHATYYNTLVGKVVLYHVEVTLDFWEEASYYWWGCQTWYNCWFSCQWSLLEGK